jgi:L-ascorbate metabolism protein UlaG (beta-lactamase superfamily)
MAESTTAGRAGATPDRIVFVGHATVLLELQGMRLLTDPLLRRRVAHLVRHAGAPHPDATVAPDAVLISHLHHDHLDVASLRMLGAGTRLLVPAGAGSWLRRRGFSSVEELDVGGQTRVGPLTVTAVESRHDGRRGPRGPRGPALGFVVSGERSVYFAGDTELFEGMSRLGPLDAALLPVAGWGPRLGPGHMDPEQAARAAALLHPRLAIPVHWGTLAPMLTRRGARARLGDPPQRFAQRVRDVAPDVEVRILMPGEQAEL